jgi:hypothetical protein
VGLSAYALLVLKSGAEEQRVVIRRTLYSAEANNRQTQQCPTNLQPKARVQSATVKNEQKCLTIKHTPGSTIVPGGKTS